MANANATLAIEGGQPAIPTRAHHSWPEITQADRDATNAVFDRGELWGLHATEVTALQEEYAAYCGAKYCLAVNSGTSALHCALVGVGVEPGTEVIVPAVSFVASAMAVLHAGAVPVFCDIDPNTYNIDPELVIPLINDRTAAIMAVHLHGLPADMDRLRAIASPRAIPLIEDAAAAHGTTYKGRKTGTLGAGAAFSLNGCKNLNAAEGGLYVCNDAAAFKAARRLAVFGEDTPEPGPGETRAFWSHSVGWNYRVHEITAALGRSQLTRLDAYNDRARRNGQALAAGLATLNGIQPPHVPADRTWSPWGFRVRFDPAAFGWEGEPTEFRDRLLWALLAEGLAADTWQLYPLPAHPVFRSSTYRAWTPTAPDEPLRPWRPTDFPEATRLLEQSLILFPARQPLYVQDEPLMAMYVDAVTKVHRRMDVVLTAPYEPVRPVPPISPSEL